LMLPEDCGISFWLGLSSQFIKVKSEKMAISGKRFI